MNDKKYGWKYFQLKKKEERKKEIIKYWMSGGIEPCRRHAK